MCLASSPYAGAEDTEGAALRSSFQGFLFTIEACEETTREKIQEQIRASTSITRMKHAISMVTRDQAEAAGGGTMAGVRLKLMAWAGENLRIKH